MISIQEAQALINGLAEPAGTERLPLAELHGRVLAEDIFAQMPVPPFHRSPLDGFAFAAADTTAASAANPVNLSVVGGIGAGQVWQDSLRSGQCLRIMTGAPIPKGADAVAAIETVTLGEQSILINKAYSRGENVSPAGEDIAEGRLVLEAGTTVGAAQTGILAALGKNRVSVYQRPRVSVLATGSELVPVGEELTAGKIYDSNSIMLANMARECGAVPVSCQLSGDGLPDLTSALKQALLDSDVVITSGGVSVGDYDLTREAVEAAGADVLFHRVAIKPGTPMLAAAKGKKMLFCLSGNPAAAFVTFWVFVCPALMKMQGDRAFRQPWISAAINHPLEVRGGQNRFIRAVTRYAQSRWSVDVAGHERPGILSSLHNANSLIFLPSGRRSVQAGETVDILFIGKTGQIT
jgi:molybdopterin molybdotransferase